MVSTLTSWLFVVATVEAASSRIGTEWSVTSLMLARASSSTRPSLRSGTASRPTSSTNATAAMRPATSPRDILPPVPVTVPCPGPPDARPGRGAAGSSRTTRGSAKHYPHQGGDRRPARRDGSTRTSPQGSVQRPDARTPRSPTKRGARRPERDSASVVLDDELDLALHGDLGALRATREDRAQLLELDAQVARDGGEDVAVRARGGDLERRRRLALRLDLEGLAGLHAERRAVDDLAVDEDVAVRDRLARLQDGAGEAGAQHERVETGLEVLDERLTGQTLVLAGLLVRTRELLLAEHVLGAQTLLLAQTDRVVGLGAAAGPAVLTRGVRALLEVLDGLRGEGDAQGAAQADLAARALDRRHSVLSFLSCVY